MLSHELDTDSSIFVTGHRGLVGSAIVRALESKGFTKILTATRDELDLRDGWAVSKWFAEHTPRYVIHAAGKVGGIWANQSYPADFLRDNTLLHASVLHAAMETQVEKLLYLGSSCIYPRDCPQPIREEYLLQGSLEETNYGYAIAKISGLLACRAYREQYDCDFIAAMPTNLYGPDDNFHPENSHVLPALIRRFHEAKVQGLNTVTIWGTGKPRREFLHVSDLAEACLFLLSHYSSDRPINVGTGVDISIKQLAELMRDLIHPGCEILFDTSKPDGTPRKLLDVSRIHKLGWRAKMDLASGLKSTYKWFCSSEWNELENEVADNAPEESQIRVSSATA